MRILFDFVDVSFSEFPQFEFFLLSRFPLLDLEWFCSFPSTVSCGFISSFKEFIPFLFKDLYHFHKGMLRSFDCASAMLEYSDPALLGLLELGTDT